MQGHLTSFWNGPWQTWVNGLWVTCHSFGIVKSNDVHVFAIIFCNPNWSRLASINKPRPLLFAATKQDISSISQLGRSLRSLHAPRVRGMQTYGILGYLGHLVYQGMSKVLVVRRVESFIVQKDKGFEARGV